MSTFLRTNAWNNGGEFQKEDGSYTNLYWYAKAVQSMQAKPINNSSSWWFFAAIHGEYLLHPIKDPRYTYLNWKNITYISSSADLDHVPTSSVSDLFWNQCQHGSWYFAPWHRGYLTAIENQIRNVIVDELQGPSDWALPYWNYLNQSETEEEFKIPPVFTVNTLPDGTPNPLYVPERYGPKGNGNIYVEIGRDIETVVNDECQWDTIYSESSPSETGSGNLFGYFYGGQETGFSHSNAGFGDLESNPHNFVHSMVGGQDETSQEMGIMGVPATAALDPIFYLHHANVDRMWAAWNKTGNNKNPEKEDWLTGPRAQGNSRFVMPVDGAGTPWYYTPNDMQDTNNIKYNGTTYAYTYDDLSLVSYSTEKPKKILKNVFERLTNLGLSNFDKTVNDIDMAPIRNNELVGASSNAITLGNNKIKTTVQFNKNNWKTVKNSFLLESVKANVAPDEVYLQLEDVKGANDTNFLSVYINDQFVNSVSLFGLHIASLDNGPHGGGGMTYTFNITNIIDDLHLNKNIDLDSLDVQISTKTEIPKGDTITIGRIGIYRSGQ